MHRQKSEIIQFCLAHCDNDKPKNDREEVMYFINVDESDDDASRKNDILDITPNKLQNIIFNSPLMLL